MEPVHQGNQAVSVSFKISSKSQAARTMSNLHIGIEDLAMKIQALQLMAEGFPNRQLIVYWSGFSAR
jgi:hypothetical protein